MQLIQHKIMNINIVFLINTYKDEKEAKKTIMYHLNKFGTNKYDFNLIDCPGDFHLRKNIIKGHSIADVSVFVVSADNENPEDDHINDLLIIAYTRGIKQLIFAINKMDLTKEPQYSEKIFLKMKKKLLNLSLNIGFDTEDIQFIPYSGLTVHNLMNKYEDNDDEKINKMSWYKGKTLLESLDEIKPVHREINNPFIISILGVYRHHSILRGRILSGKLFKNDKIKFNTEKHSIITEMASIQKYDNEVNEAMAGDIISFRLKGLTYREIKSCNLIFNQDLSFKKIKSIRAKILVVNKTVLLKKGFTLTFFCSSLNKPIDIVQIEYLIDGANRILEKEPEFVKFGQHAIVKMEINKEKKYDYGIILEKYKKNKVLGSFELFNDYFIAVGKILDLENEVFKNNYY